MILQSRRIDNNVTITLIFRIQNTKRIHCKTLLAVIRQSVLMRAKIVNKCCAIGQATFSIAKRIEMQNTFVQYADIGQHPRPTGNNFRISQRIGRAQIFNTNLVKLAHPPFLWAFITEHRACIEKFQRQALCQTPRNHGTNNASRIFWSQCYLLTAAVFKGISFLGHHITAGAKRL